MYIYKVYDKDTGIERAWYNSSNILYSECDDIKDAYKTLRVTFRNGSTYEYHNVDVNDYLLFRQGALNGSNGKAFAKYIKAKYQFTKLPQKNPADIEKELEDEREKKKQQELTIKEVKEENKDA